MQIEFNWLTVLLMVVISQSALAAGLLFFAKNNRQSNRILACLILAIALWLTDNFLRLSGIYHQRPDLYFLPLFYSLAFGPLIWFYVRSLVNARFKFSRADFVHFIPLVLQVCLYGTLAFASYKTKYWYWEEVHKPYTYRLEFDGTFLSLTIYVVLSFRLIRKYQTWVVDQYSEVSRIKLNWLRTMLAALIILCMQWFAEIILRDVFGQYFRYDYTVELLGILLLMLGISGLRQASLAEVSFLQLPVEKSNALFEPDEDVLHRISETMQLQRPYLNPTLTLNELAAMLKLNSRVVSRNINAGFGQSFNDYINKHRVEEVKRRLQAGDLERLNMLGIAMESGFNSKTNFNRIFKEMTGVPPSEYLK